MFILSPKLKTFVSFDGIRAIYGMIEMKWVTILITLWAVHS